MKKNKKIILITGVAGMIGSELTNKFIKDKNNIIIGIDNFILGTKNNIKQFTKNDNFKFFKINLEKKIKNNRLNKFLANKTINEIWHLAANSDIRSGVSNADVDFKNTFLTTYNTLELIKKNINHNSKFIFTSSSAVFGDIKININETTPALYSCSNYGSMKLASEAIISSYSYLNKIKSIVFRLPNVVGKNLTHGVIFDLSNKIKDKKKNYLQVLGDGNQCKPYSHATEIVNCMIFVSKVKHSKFINYYNIGNNDKGIKVKDIVNLLVKKFDFNKKVKFQKLIYGWKGDVPNYKYSTKKINNLGFKFSLNSLETIKKTILELKK